MRQVLGNAPGRPQLAGRLPVKLLFSSALRCSKPWRKACGHSADGCTSARAGQALQGGSRAAADGGPHSPPAHNHNRRGFFVRKHTPTPSTAAAHRSVRLRNAPSAAQASGRGPAVLGERSGHTVSNANATSGSVWARQRQQIVCTASGAPTVRHAWPLRAKPTRLRQRRCHTRDVLPLDVNLPQRPVGSRRKIHGRCQHASAVEFAQN